MATFEVLPAHPNVLIIYDSEIYRQINLAEPDETALWAYLRSMPANCPVTLGSHDFWILHPRPNPSGSIKTGNGFDPSFSPRPYRGTVRMGDSLTNWNSDTASKYIVNSWLQEVGHGWLVPTEANGLKVDGETFLGREAFLRAFFDGTAFPRLSLFRGRANHWGMYVSAGTSPIDGANWKEREALPMEGTDLDEIPGQNSPRILRRYSPEPSTVTFTAPDISGPVQGTAYSDLDLTIMGAMNATEAYADQGNSFDVIAPQWMSPLNFHTGLALVFAPDDIIYFGFHGDFKTIKVERTGNAYLPTFDLSSIYRPWTLEQRMLLRIVKRGSQYHFQARPDLGNIGCLGAILQSLGVYTPPSPIDPFSEADNIPVANSNPSNWQQWNTLLTVPESTAPKGIGYIVRTWGGRESDTPIPMVDVNFKPLQIQTPSGSRAIDSVSEPTNDANYLAGLSPSGLTFHRPKLGPQFRRGWNLGNMAVSPSLASSDVGSFNHWIGIDESPKLIAATPPNNQDFIAAGSVYLNRSLLVSWDNAAGQTLWGFRRKIPMNSLALDQAHEAHRRWDGMPYKAAFIVVAPIAPSQNDSAALSQIDNMVANVDRMRQGCEAAFFAATQSHRQMDTSLTSTPG